MGIQIPHGKGQFWGGKGHPIVKYRDTLQSSMQKRLNRSRCHLGCGLGWAVGIVLDGGPVMLKDVAMATNFGTKIAINLLCVNNSDWAISYGGGLSGRPTECRYCWYPAPKGWCHGNHFLAFYIWDAHWCHLVNTTEPSMCGGDVTLCQITLTGC